MFPLKRDLKSLPCKIPAFGLAHQGQRSLEGSQAMQTGSSREQQPTAEPVLGSVAFTCGSGGYMGFLLSGVQRIKGLGHEQG